MIFINHIDILNGDAAIVEVDGPLSSETSPDFEDYINQLLEKNRSYILFDASKLKFVSSEGIGVILHIQKKLSESNGYFVIYNIPDEVMSLYRILGFDKVFTIAESKIDAMQIMDRHIELRDGGREDSEETGTHDKIVSEKVAGAGTLQDTEVKNISDNETALSNNKTAKESKEVITQTETVSGNIRFDPFLVECMKCKTLVRVKKPGSYMCPTCKVEFSVQNDQTVKFD